MSSCAPASGADDSDPINRYTHLVIHSFKQSSWQATLALDPVERLADNAEPLHSGMDGVIAIFDREPNE